MSRHYHNERKYRKSSLILLKKSSAKIDAENFRSQMPHDQRSRHGQWVNDFVHPEFSRIGGFSAESSLTPDPFGTTIFELGSGERCILRLKENRFEVK